MGEGGNWAIFRGFFFIDEFEEELDEKILKIHPMVIFYFRKKKLFNISEILLNRLGEIDIILASEMRKFRMSKGRHFHSFFNFQFV